MGPASLSGPNAGDFQILSQSQAPRRGSLASSRCADPPTALGTSNATLSLPDNDGGQPSPFTFAIGGESINPQAAVSYDNVPVVDGSTTTDVANGTDFGTLPVVGTPVTELFAVRNGSLSELMMGNVSIGGADPADFKVVAQYPGVVQSGTATSFSIEFAPTALGTRTATVSFTEDDATEPSPFTFTVSGEATAKIYSHTATVTFLATDAQGNVLTSVPVGTTFLLQAYVQDSSGNGSSGGIDSAYVDGSYDDSLATIASNAYVQIDFSTSTSANLQTPGQLLNVGGSTGLSTGGSSLPRIMFSVPVTATAVGPETFTPAMPSLATDKFLMRGRASL